MERTVVNQATGEQITFLQTAKETDGKYLHIEVTLPPHGNGPPLHTHDQFEESFEVISGKLTVTLGKTEYILEKGDERTVAIGTAHTFTNKHDESVTFRVILTPPSQFEESVRIHYGLIDDGLTDETGKPKSLAHSALILTMQNTLVAGIPLWIQRPLFGFIVKRARKKGQYKQLEKYTTRNKVGE